VPATSRVAVRRGAASLRGNNNVRVASGAHVDVATALRTSREALSVIEGQLEALLAALRDPTAALDKRAPDRLRGATQDAGTALASLTAARPAF
jgi:hypothetical protein